MCLAGVCVRGGGLPHAGVIGDRGEILPHAYLQVFDPILDSGVFKDLVQRLSIVEVVIYHKETIKAHLDKGSDDIFIYSLQSLSRNRDCPREAAEILRLADLYTGAYNAVYTLSQQL